MNRFLLATLFSFGISGPATSAQSIASEIQDLANELAQEGFTSFTLENGLFSGQRLIAQQHGMMLVVELEPETLQVNQIIAVVDEDGDGRVSRRERRRGIVVSELPRQAAMQAREALRRVRGVEGSDGLIISQSIDGNNSPDANTSPAPRSRPNASTGSNEGTVSEQPAPNRPVSNEVSGTTAMLIVEPARPNAPGDDRTQGDERGNSRSRPEHAGPVDRDEDNTVVSAQAEGSSPSDSRRGGRGSGADRKANGNRDK